MKRYVSMVIILIMVCSSVLSLNVQAETDIHATEVNTYAIEAMNFLRSFGIIPDHYDYNTSFAGDVTRGEFVDTVANLIGVDNYIGNDVHYYDVPRTHYAYGGICTLSEMGIINGTGDNIFEPDVIIDDTAAYKILLNAMGWGDWAHYNGGYPTGYLYAAQKAEIYVESQTEKVTLDEMFIMIYKAATGIILDGVGYSNDGIVKMIEKENESLLSIYHGIYNAEGTVTAADLISITDKSVRRKDEVIIDDVVYDTEVDVSEYLGHEVKFFYRESKNGSNKVIVWVESAGNTEVLRVEADHDVHFNENSFVYTYFKEDKNRQITLSKGMVLIYNGRIVDDNYGEILNKTRYTAEFLKTSGEYKTVIVKAYENYVVETIDSVNGIIYDKFNPTKSLDLNDNSYEYISIKISGGAETSISAIKTDDVLSAFLSQDKKRLEVIVETTSKTGVVSNLNTTDRHCIIKIDDEKYYMPVEQYHNEYGAGDTIRLYIDYTGMVAAAEIETGGSLAAYVIDCTINHLIDETAMLKIFSQNGSVGVYETAERITIDGKSNCNAVDVINAFTNEEGVEQQLVLLDMDSEGKIRSIDTSYVNPLYESSSNTLTQNMILKSRHYKVQGYFYNDAVIDSNTVIFGIPEDSTSKTDESLYKIMKKQELPDDTIYNAMSYNISDRGGYEDYVVIKKPSVNNYNYELPLLVTGKGEMLNSKGDTVECLIGYRGKDEVSVCSDGKLSFNGITEGMLVRFAYSSNGDAADMTILYDPANKENYYTQKVPFNDVYGIEVGFVNDIIGDVIKIGYNSGANVSNIRNQYGSPVVLVYDADERVPAYIGSFGDAKRYYNVGDECSQVVLISRHCTPRLYIFYN